MTRRLTLLFDLMLKRPALLLSLLMVLLGLLAWQIPRLTLDASADSLVLEGDRALAFYREVNKRYQAQSFLVVTYAPDAPLYSPPVLARIAKLRDELAALPDVASVTSILDVPLLYSPPVRLSRLEQEIRYLSQPEVDLELAAREFSHSPLYRNLLTSSDADTTALQVNLQRDSRYFQLLDARDTLRNKRAADQLSAAEQRTLHKAEAEFREYAIEANKRERKLVAEVRRVLDRHRDHGTLFLGGVVMIAADMIAFIENDLTIFGSATVLFIVALMAIIFRRLRWVLLPLATCLATVLAMLGYLAWARWQLTVISSNFTALLLIITLSITIHLVVRYREYHAANPHASQRQLVIQTLAFMAKPCLFTSLTTIVAFASLVVSGIRPVIDFGWMMTIGVSVALLMAFTLLPAGLLLLPLGGPEVRPRHRPLSHYFARCTDRYGRQILWLSAALLLTSLLGISRLQVENRFIDYFHETTEIYQGMEVIDRELGGTVPLEILLTRPAAEALPSTDEDPFAEDPFAEDPFADPFADDQPDQPVRSYWFSRAGLEELSRVHQYLDSLPETGKVMSLASLYQVLQDVAGEDIDDFQLALLRRNLPARVDELLVQPFLSPDGREARITVRVMETSRTLQRDALIKQVRQQLTGHLGYAPGQVQLTGMLVLYNNMLQSLFGSQIATLGAVFVAITLTFTLLFRSLFLALIAIAPNLLAAGMVLGFMGWVGIPLDMMTITIAAITVGIGVDDTIHYIHRFREEFPKDRDYRATMYRCHGSIGKAMFYTSVIIIAGFSILALSNFTPTIYFGLLTSLAMFSALMGALLLLPQLIIALKPLGGESAE
ncbi:efflux RND transporter permease subunit [Marinobacterium arenosum]|uniref:efflux RND transporter permease subunit n=1 Tax=Marinobacterium arenosum TaxID=2862496 RepID=UPI001C96EFFC|nr:MMPL family transporter [Marinobacterium arenosum]MBY4677710.1 MMPL family transporter [Marinobacterium arenosum]